MYCDSLNITDFREFTYSVPSIPPVPHAAYLNAANNNIIQYVDAGGAIFQRYKTFAIKIVLTADARIYVPKVDDVRAIAVQA